MRFRRSGCKIASVVFSDELNHTSVVDGLKLAHKNGWVEYFVNKCFFLKKNGSGCMNVGFVSVGVCL